MSKQRRDDKTDAAEIVARHTMMGTEQAARFVEGCEFFIYTCEALGLAPEEEIFDLAYHASERHPVLSDVMSRMALASDDLDDLAACAANHEILIGRVNSFMEVGE